jgi:hypothetical protein
MNKVNQNGKPLLPQIKGVTPAAPAVWPRIEVPDYKFNPDGLYSIGVLLDPSKPEVKRMLTNIDKVFADTCAAIQATLPKGKTFRKNDLPYKNYLTKDGEETGQVLVSFKMKAQGKTKDGRSFDKKPVIFDKWAKPVTEEIGLGGGSIVKVSYIARGFYVPAIGVGVTLTLEAVQILELKRGFNKNDATTYGFSAEEAAEEDTEDRNSEAPASEETTDF